LIAPWARNASLEPAASRSLCSNLGRRQGRFGCPRRLAGSAALAGQLPAKLRRANPRRTQGADYSSKSGPDGNRLAIRRPGAARLLARHRRTP
jgi:hypothetical protein